MCHRGTRRVSGAFLAALLLTALPTAPAIGADGHAGSAPLLQPVDAEGLERVIDAQRGKVVVLNFWATWCEPCREEFPDLVRVAREFSPRLALVTVSLDDPDLAASTVTSFLKEMKAPAPALIKRPGDPDPFIRSVDPEWSGALPATFVHAADGRRVHAVYGPVDRPRLLAMVKPLLSEAE